MIKNNFRIIKKKVVKKQNKKIKKQENKIKNLKINNKIFYSDFLDL